MKRIKRRAMVMLILPAVFLACLGVFLFRYATRAAVWAGQDRNPNAGAYDKLGTVTAGDGTALFGSGAYAEDKTLRLATLHAVGDAKHNIITGVRRLHRSTLAGYDLVNGLFNPEEAGGSVSLTLDPATCVAAYNALGGYSGTVGVYNYKTGEMLCMVSKPDLDPANPPSSLPEGAYVNRLTAGQYTPGSIFKLVTAAAAIDHIDDIHERTFTCKRGAEIGGKWIACTGNHGTLDFDTALVKSCNAAFGEISVELGPDILAAYAARAGVTQSFDIDGTSTLAGSFSVEGADENELAWAGIGQHTDVVNPMQMLIYMGAVANGGRAVTPYYVDSVKSAAGLPVHSRLGTKREDRMLSSETAGTLASMMRRVVADGYGDSNFKGMDMCGKTGTAQVGGNKPHAWFAGFSANEDTPLAIVVILEQAGSGSDLAVPAARKVMVQAVQVFE